MKILVIKTSSLGDIIQSFYVLSFLKSKFKDCQIDWVVEKRFYSIVDANTLIDEAIEFDVRFWKRNFYKKSGFVSFYRFVKNLRRCKYDAVFDLQGNCKSSIALFFARSNKKIGFSRKSVAEWPNLLFSNMRFFIDKKSQINNRYLNLVRSYYKDQDTAISKKIEFLISKDQKRFIENKLKAIDIERRFVMICPCSKWPNKEINLILWQEFLKKISSDIDVHYFFVGSNSREKKILKHLYMQFEDRGIYLQDLSILSWQYLISKMNLVISVDSSSLHLSSISGINTFSIFGPSSYSVYKPIGQNHGYYQGCCDLGDDFETRCKSLRYCKTASCIKNIDIGSLYKSFYKWFTSNNYVNNDNL
jgi:heptosyltransferase I